MSILGKIFGEGIAKPVEAVGSVLDKLFTSDEERLTKKALLEKLKQQPQLAQIELNKIEAQHKSMFVAGWRPFIGWVCGFGFAYDFILRPLLVTMTLNAPSLDSSTLMSLVLAMLGLSGMRTFDKLKGTTTTLLPPPRETHETKS